jgi:ABC-type multidrug transport system ATPase subunit
MLTHLTIRNFKRFSDASIELGNSVVLIGPNNSGKTTALQALALWEIGMRRWGEKRKGGKSPAEKRPGVTINRRDLVSLPVPAANLLWRNLHVRDVERVAAAAGKSDRVIVQNVRVSVIVDGITDGVPWSCGLEFDYANEESFYCRPLAMSDGNRMPVPEQAGNIRVSFLPPMSGLADREFIKQSGEIALLVGQGQTAQVIRNLCYAISSNDISKWNELSDHVQNLFGVQLLPPEYVAERSELTMFYKDERGIKLDLSSSGRGLQQTLLLLSYLYTNPNTVLLLDEPDAHLEVLRQRQTFNLITAVARQQNSQVVVASHSEVILNEAASTSTVVAFVGRPHQINDRGSQLLKSLSDIGWDQYLQAEQTGWVLYLEGASDLEILREFASIMHHEKAQAVLSRPFVHYVATNLPSRARDHFFGLREARTDLVGVALFDRLEKTLDPCPPLKELQWRKREIENYFTTHSVLIAYAIHDLPDDLFGHAEAERRVSAMEESIAEVVSALETLGQPETQAWSDDIKSSDQFLEPVFRKFFDKLHLPVLMRKSNYHMLASLVKADEIDPEVKEKLDAIVEIAGQASAAREA